jgi:hypothetical protein
VRNRQGPHGVLTLERLLAILEMLLDIHSYWDICEDMQLDVSAIAPMTMISASFSHIYLTNRTWSLLHISATAKN